MAEHVLSSAQELVATGDRLMKMSRVVEAELCFQQAAATESGLPSLDDRLRTTRLATSGIVGSMDSATILNARQSVHSDQVFLRGYQDLFESIRQSRYMDYPKQFHLETLAQCNASCGFCPYPTMERQGVRMSDALVAKILRDMKDIPADLPIEICPFKVNEPFLDHRIFDIIGTIERDLPNATIIITTNASPLTEKKIEQLTKTKALRYFHISFADHRKDEYERVMKIPYDRTISRLDDLHRAVEGGRIYFPIHMTKVGDGSTADEEFLLWAKTRYPHFATAIYNRQNWLGQVDQDPFQTNQYVGCHRWFEMSIVATGVVAHCCMDGDAEWPLGDLNQNHILEIYNQPRLRSLREKAVIRNMTSPCARCALTAR